MTREPRPEEAEQCAECRGRGQNFDRKEFRLEDCESCDGKGWLLPGFDAAIDELLREARAADG